MEQTDTADITDPTNYEAIGRCVHLLAEINEVEILRLSVSRGLSRPEAHVSAGSEKMVYLSDIGDIQRALDDFRSANTKLKELMLEHNKWALLAGRQPIKIIDLADQPGDDGKPIGVDGKYDTQWHTAIS